MTNKYLIGVDIGGTNTKIGIVDLKGNIVIKSSIETNANNEIRTLAKRVYTSCQNLIYDIAISWKNIICVGIGSPGILDRQKGVLIFSPNTKTWTNEPIVKIFQDELKVVTILENDANAAAWGERWVGVGKGKNIKSLVMVTLGTGIGGGIVIDDKIWHGCFNVAGELGHITIEAEGTRCNCGNYGCAEAYASATAVVNRYLLASKNETEITAEKIYSKAIKGNKTAIKVLTDSGRYLGILIVNIMHTLNPDIIVIGGGMAAAKNIFYPSLVEEIKKRGSKFASKCTDVVFGKLGNDAGMIGVAGWALKTLETSV